MRCPTCDHENPKNTPRCEACGAALSPGAGASPVNPGRRVTSFEPAPFLPFTPAPPAAAPPAAAPPAASPPAPSPAFSPPAGFSPAAFAPGAPVPVVPPPAPFVPSPLPPAGASPFPTPVEGRRTVAEPAPVLPPVPASSTAPAPLPLPPPPLASPFGVPLPVTSLPGQAPAGSPLSGFPGTLASPLASPLSMPGGASLSATAAPGLAAGRVEATRLAQSPEVGGAPQLRGALFEYRGLGHPGFIHTLREGKNVLGRDPAVCDVVLEDDRASKQHAFLFIRDEDVSLLDISTNGSTVDGRPVRGSEVRLSSPSVIQVGGLRLIFVFLPRRLVDGL